MLRETAMGRAPLVTLAQPPLFDDRRANRLIGLIALATDHTAEHDFARLYPLDHIAVYVNRIAYANPTTSENLLQMQPRLSDAAKLILLGEALDAAAYSCTAAVMYIGEQALAAAVQAAKSGGSVVTPVAAALAAFELLGAARLSLLTPYSRRVTAAMVEFFEGRGFEVVSTACFGLEDDREMARVEPSQSVTAMGCEAEHKAEHKAEPKNELDPSLVARADRYAADRRAQCAALGECHHATAAGALPADKDLAEFGEVVAGKMAGPTHDDQITAADLAATGVQDTAIATLARARAEAAGAGASFQT
jgi:maleate isomerase